MRATGVDVAAEFQGGARTIGGRGSRLGQAFMVIQIAVSLVLLVSTGLFVRTVNSLQMVDAGFNRQNLVLFRIDATSAGYSHREAVALHNRIQERLETLPGARAATFSRVALLSRTRQNMTFSIPGRTLPPETSMNVNTNGLAVNFFSAMELPLVLGRSFTERDDDRSPRVAVVNQTFARNYFGGENPVGRHLVFNAPDFRHEVEIVGVAGDAKYTELRGAIPATVYFPALQQPDGNANFAVRVEADLPGVFAAIRAVVREVDPAVPVVNLRTQAEQIDRLHGQERLFARLSGFFGLTALALACLGLYGLMSDAVLRRWAEIGLRLALGARPSQILAMIVRESVWLACLGAALGLAAAFASVRIVATMLFGVSPTDPLTYSAIAVLLIPTAALASAVPAWRASRIQPLDALRTMQ
jgi:predicted permease